MYQLIGAAALGAMAVVAVQRFLSSRKVSGKIRMGYWGIRGLGAPMRMMLEYSGADYEDTLYTDPNAWFGGKKPELLKKNALANLPYLEMPDGSVVSESNACYMRLDEALGLSPTTEGAKIKATELLSLCMCTRNDLTNRCYSFNGMCADRAAFDTSFKKLLASKPFAKYEATLKAAGTAYFCGDTPCACDFHVCPPSPTRGHCLHAKPACEKLLKRMRTLHSRSDRAHPRTDLGNAGPIHEGRR